MNRVLSIILFSFICIMVMVAYNYATSQLPVDQTKSCCFKGFCDNKTDCGMKK